MTKTLAIWTLAALTLIYLRLWTAQNQLTAGFPSLVTGWILFGVLVALALFNIRKKLSVLPLSNASNWLNLHLPGGMLAVGLFWLHTGSEWPLGIYERFLAVLFYLTTLTGLFGLLIQRSFPRRLTQSGAEYIFERIPMEIYSLQEQARELLLTCTRQTRRDTLATQYLTHLDWYFQRPRFFMNHVFGGKKSETWIRQQCSNIEPALNPQERTFLQNLFTLANAKKSIDLHYALQSILKFWVLFHLPLAAALMTLTLWHLLLVSVYFL
jgi:hypothetical protein